MRTGKKITTMAAAAALSMAMATTAFGAAITTSGGSDSVQVRGIYNAGSGGTVYKVDVTWESMEFTYTASSEGTWNPETHAYDGGGTGSWSSDTNTITVTNHSNAAVTGTFAFAGAADFEGITASFSSTTDGTFTLADASQGASLNNPSNAPSVSSDMTLTGDPGEFTDGTTIGTVTVTITDSSTVNAGE